MLIKREWKAELEALAKNSKALSSLLERIEVVESDISSSWYLEMSLTISSLGEELRMVREGDKQEASILTSPDKTFDRIVKLLTEGDKIFKSLEEGKKLIAGDSTESQKRAGKIKGVAL